VSTDPPGPDVWALRHGATEWSASGQHTGRTDLPLTADGVAQARALGAELAGVTFTLVLTSPRTRARRTCELAGLGAGAEVDDDLAEWDYGDYEGRTSEEIQAEVPGWTIWTDGCPGGESIAEVAARADRVITRVQRVRGNVALFAHGHILRILIARWCELPPIEGRRFVLDTAKVTILGWEHDYSALRRLNG
jgi:probable phosphoglycerate mutase